MDMKSRLIRRDQAAMAPCSLRSSPTRKLIRPRSLSLLHFSMSTTTASRNEKIEERRDAQTPDRNVIFMHANGSETPFLSTVCECGGEIGKRRREISPQLSPTSAPLSKRQFSKQLSKTPSTSNSWTSKFPQSPSKVQPTASSPTGKSKAPLPSSPQRSCNHQKRRAFDFNPFGADLVRYKNQHSTAIASTRMSFSAGKRISEVSSEVTLCPMVNEKETTFMGKANGKAKLQELKAETPDLEQSGTDFWHEPNTVGDAVGNTVGFLRNRFSTRRIRNRLMQKDGECNISLYNVPKQKTKYFADIFTTLVEVKWRWCLLIFALGFLLSWLLFALVYYLIMLSHGDFDENQTKDPKWRYCINEIRSFVSIFLFSLESQHTIGYGSRYPSEECPVVVATVCLQAMVGVMIQTFMAGIVFAKLARAKKRAETLIFSKNAVVCMRDGNLCFLFRVGDMRKSQLAEAHVRLQMISKRITNEGELLPFHQFDMNVGYDCGLDRIFVVWPITICHVIDENSPLYEYSADDLATARFEIIAILEGVVPSTGTTTQARTSYLPQEIIWGSRFEKLVTYQRENGEYRIDFSKFHKTYSQETPTCSAKDLDLLREVGWNLDEVYHVEGEDQAENQGLTPYSTVNSRMEPKRPSILPLSEDHGNADGETENHFRFSPLDEDNDETGRLLPNPPSTAALITMTPAERKASIAAAAAAFRKNKSLSESIRKVSLGVHQTRFRKPSMNMVKIAAENNLTGPSRRQKNSSTDMGVLRHAASTGSVAVLPPGHMMKPRPSSVLREHDIM